MNTKTDIKNLNSKMDIISRHFFIGFCANKWENYFEQLNSIVCNVVFLLKKNSPVNA